MIRTGDKLAAERHPLPAIAEAVVEERFRKKARPDRISPARSFERAYDFARSEFNGNIGVSTRGSIELTAIRNDLYTLSDSPNTRCRIVHGFVGDHLPYAWVELDNLVFDPGYQRFYDRLAWYAATGAVNGAEYTLAQADQLLQDHHSYGPWLTGGTTVNVVVSS